MKTKKGFVYLIRAETGHYKIGRTKNVPRRLGLFGILLPFKFEIIHYFICDDAIQSESVIHGRFAQSRINGEWFDLTQEEVNTITSIGFQEDRAFINIYGEEIRFSQFSSYTFTE